MSNKHSSSKPRSISKNKLKTKRFSSSSLRSSANKYHQTAMINASPRAITPVFFDGGTHANGGQHMAQHSNPLLEDDDDSPTSTPAANPGHKKNAMSNFLSIFNFQPKRKSSSSTNDFEAMTDLEVLKQLKKSILEILTKMIDIKKLKKLKAELKERIWEHEYTELKSRLSLHDIHTSMNNQKLSQFDSLKQYTTIQDDGNDDVQEVASYLLQEFFDHPAATLSRSTVVTHGADNDHARHDMHEDIDEEEEEYSNVNGGSQATFVTPLKIPRAVSFEREDASLHAQHLENRKKEAKRNKKRSKHDKHDKQQPHAQLPQPRSNSKSRDKHKRSKKDLLHTQNEHRNSDQTKGTHLLLAKKAEEAQPTTPNTYTYEQRKSGAAAATHMADESTSSFPDAVAGDRILDKMHASDDADADSIETVQQLEQLLSEADDTACKMNSPRHSSFLTRIGDRLKSVLSTVGTWDFDPFELYELPEVGGRGLVLSTWYLMDKYNLFALFPQLSLKKFLTFMDLVEKGYMDNPYHNQMHATDVVSNVAYYLNDTAFFQNHCSDFDKFCAIISAAVHDLGHDGNNNAYHITTMSDIALTYNDSSVLENYHLAMAFKTLKRPECNWYKQLSSPVQRYLRQALIDMVLATDMKYHNQKLASLTGLIAILKQQLQKSMAHHGMSDSLPSSASPYVNGTPSYSLDELKEDRMHRYEDSSVSGVSVEQLLPPHKQLALSDFPLHKYKVNERGVGHLLSTLSADVMNEGSNPRVNDVLDERRFLLCWVVHLCDISNCAKSIKAGKKWAIRVMTEFFKQGDREKSQGLEVSAMMDRRRSSISSGQIGFIKFVLLPSYSMFVRLVPEAAGPVGYLNENLAYWQEQQKLANKARSQRSKSLGAGGLAENQALLMMQDQLKKLKLERDPSETPQPVSPLSAKGNEDDTAAAAAVMPMVETSDDDDDDTRSQKSVRIRDDDGDEEDVVGDLDQTQTQTAYSHSGKNRNGKSVGFAEQIVVVARSSRSSIASSTTTNNDDDEADDNLAPLQSRQRLVLSNTKARAHSIHVSIPTSDKQLQSQPQPFSDVMAVLTKQHLDEIHKEKRVPKSPTKNKRRPKSDHLETIRNTSKKIYQSTSVPIGFEAKLGVDTNKNPNGAKGNGNGNDKKQKRDMV